MLRQPTVSRNKREGYYMGKLMLNSVTRVQDAEYIKLARSSRHHRTRLKFISLKGWHGRK